MNPKMLIMAVLVGAAAMSANAGIRFGVSIGLPLPLVVTTPFAPKPVTGVETVPVCAGVGCVWAAAFGSYRTTGHARAPGAGCRRPVPVVCGRCCAGRCW